MQCKICSKDFIPIRITQKYCSRECYLKSYGEKHKKPKEVRYRIVCGNELPKSRSVYCGDECSRKAKKDYMREYTSGYGLKSHRHKKPKLSIEEINAQARAEGLTYGQYVGKYGL